jgi:hypothetical protein
MVKLAAQLADPAIQTMEHCSLQQQDHLQDCHLHHPDLSAVATEQDQVSHPAMDLSAIPLAMQEMVSPTMVPHLAGIPITINTSINNINNTNIITIIMPLPSLRITFLPCSTTIKCLHSTVTILQPPNSADLVVLSVKLFRMEFPAQWPVGFRAW